MYLVGMEFVPYREGDENIVIGADPTTSTTNNLSQSGHHLYFPYPNPARDEVTLSFYLKEGQPINIEVFDAKKTLVQSIVDGDQFTPGNHKITFEVSQLPAGIYTVQMSNNGMRLSRPLVIR